MQIRRNLCTDQPNCLAEPGSFELEEKPYVNANVINSMVGIFKQNIICSPFFMHKMCRACMQSMTRYKVRLLWYYAAITKPERFPCDSIRYVVMGSAGGELIKGPSKVWDAEFAAECANLISLISLQDWTVVCQSTKTKILPKKINLTYDA